MIPFFGYDPPPFISSATHLAIRSTRPKTLLQMSAMLFSHACVTRQENRIDSDVFHNGISYFLGPLLNWTLVGVVHAMLFEVQQKGWVVHPTSTHPLSNIYVRQTCCTAPARGPS